MPEQHFNVWLFSNPGDNILFLLEFNEARISEWNIGQRRKSEDDTVLGEARLRGNLWKKRNNKTQYKVINTLGQRVKLHKKEEGAKLEIYSLSKYAKNQPFLQFGIMLSLNVMKFKSRFALSLSCRPFDYFTKLNNMCLF